MKWLSLSFTIFSIAFCGLAHCNEPTLVEEEVFSLESENPSENDLLSLEDEVFSLQDNGEEKSALTEEPSPNLLINGNHPEVVETPKLFIEEETTFPIEIKTEIEEPVLKTAEETTFQETSATNPGQGLEISFKQVFAGSPLIYSILFTMSFFCMSVWLYSLSRIKKKAFIPDQLYNEVKNRILEKEFSEASKLCENGQNLFSRILSEGLTYRKYGLQAVLEGMKSEGKRSTVSSWQRLSLLQDVAVIAPMLGLLGTVLGMFYAFYDLNRSFESIANLFDGLGISVGTTVAGIGVAILAMILHSTAKFRLIRALSNVESRAYSLAHLMEEKQ